MSKQSGNTQSNTYIHNLPHILHCSLTNLDHSLRVRQTVPMFAFFYQSQIQSGVMRHKQQALKVIISEGRGASRLTCLPALLSVAMTLFVVVCECVCICLVLGESTACESSNKGLILHGQNEGKIGGRKEARNNGKETGKSMEGRTYGRKKKQRRN